MTRPTRTGEDAKPYRRFTDAEREAVLDRYPTEGAIPLAIEFGRKRSDIVSVAQRLGVHRLAFWTGEDDATLIERVAKRESVPSIAQAMGRTIASVYKRREHLGLSKPRPPQGPKSPTKFYIASETRWAKVRVSLGEHGWPPELTVKQVLILESLRIHGPQARRILSRSIGEPAERADKRRLMTHSSMSAIEPLRLRGLVARLTLGTGRSRVTIYALTTYATASHGKFGSVQAFYQSILKTRAK